MVIKDVQIEVISFCFCIQFCICFSNWSSLITMPIGNLNQPKWGHLQKLQVLIRSVERTMTYGSVRKIDYGNMVEVRLNVYWIYRRKRDIRLLPVRQTYIPYTKTYSSFQCCRHQNIILMELQSVSLVMQMKQKMSLLTLPIEGIGLLGLSVFIQIATLKPTTLQR